MKSIVIYHSISGNTKKIAEAVHAGLTQDGEPADIARLRDISPDDLVGYDLIGLGSPVMHHRELRNVNNFIQNTLTGVDGKHSFAFCTHGAMPGHYLSRVVPAMIQRGLTVIGWNDWFCGCTFPLIPKPYFTDGHPDDIDLQEAAEFGREMAERSRRIYAGETGLVPVLPSGREYDEIYRPTPGPSAEVQARFFRIQSGIEFKVNQEKCRYPKCTVCMDNCPMSSIDFSVSPPFFRIDCEHCWLCEQACPTGAIEIDWQPLHEAHLPMVPPLEESLKVFEARGKFRRLVPLEDIGWDTYAWQQPRPRLKIV